MKFLFATDTHATLRGPKSRTDSYSKAVLRKLTELSTAAKQLGVEAVFHGGDLFDKPVVSIDFTGEIAKIIRGSEVPWYVVPGNHDLFGYNIQTLPQTSLGLLSRTGVINILDRAAGPMYWGSAGAAISFEGQEYHREIDKRDPAHDYYVTSSADYKILIPHSMLLDKPYFPDIPHTLTSDLTKVAKNARPNEIWVGHYHDGYRPQRVDEILVTNPGSMLRDEASKGNMKRKPQYMLIEFDGSSVTKTMVPFQTAEDGKKIFDRSHIDEKRAKEYYLQSFEQKLTDSALDAVDVRSVLDKTVALDDSIPQEIALEAYQSLTEAEQSLTDIAAAMTGYQEKADNIFITKIELKGFQSHDHTCIEFGPGLNAITGPSDAGKSAVIRAMRFALYNEPRGSDFIRQGSSAAEVILHFNDGGSIKRSRTRKSAGSYIIRHPGDEEIVLQGFTNHIPVDVANIHQMPYLQLAKDLETTLNIGMQLEGPFLIGESPATRASIIGKLTGVNLVDGAIREISKEILANNASIKLWNTQVEEIDEKLEGFADLPQLEQKIKDITTMMTDLEVLEKQLADLDAIQTGLDLINPEIKDLRKQFADADRIAQNAEEVIKVQAQFAVYTDLQNCLSGIQKCDTMIAEIQQEIANLRITPEDQLDCLAASISEWTVLKQTHQQIAENRGTINDLRKQIRLAEISAQAAEEEYQATLEEAGHCPTCNQPILKGAHAHG